MTEARVARLSKPPLPLHVRMEKHLINAVMGIEKQKLAADVESKLKEVWRNVRAVDVESFLQESFRKENIFTGPFGNKNLKRHGLSFGIEAPKNDNYLIRLYQPAGLSQKASAEIATHLFGAGAIQRLVFGGAREQGLLQRKASEETHYFSSAEIVMRALAHKYYPEANPQPTALVNKDAEPIGFFLKLKNHVAYDSGMETEIVDTFFDLETTLGLSKSLSPKVHRTYKDLKPLNIVPYVENEKDTENMLLFDKNDRFITFNRIGYLG